MKKLFVDPRNISRINFRNDINILRALAVLAVVMYHYELGNFNGGWLGVDVFFLISGYLIGNIIISELNTNKFTFKNFYQRRIKRLLPTLLLTNLLTLIFGLVFLDYVKIIELSRSIIASVFFYANYFFAEDNDMSAGVRVIGEDHKIYNNYRSRLLVNTYHHQAQQYYCSKCSWNSQTFQSINWLAIQRAMSMCSSATRVWVSKFSCDFIGTARMLARREYWLESKCPRCGSDNETTTHIIQCPHPPHREQIDRRIDDFRLWMESRHFEPDLCADIINVTTSWVRGDESAHPSITCAPVATQLQIGWDHFKMGRVNKSITDHLHSFYLTKKLH